MSDDQALLIDLRLLAGLIREAGTLALSYFGRATAQWKADNTLVSEADRTVEQFLIDRLASNYPATAVLGEEFGRNQQVSDHLWVLDPIDGTAAFLSGFPVWGISVGYMYRGGPQAGAFYLPVTDELYIGDHHSAYLNDRPIPPCEPAALHSESTLLIPSNTHRDYSLKFSGKTRNFGSAGAHLCYVVAGRAVATILDQVNLWDIAGVWPMLLSRGYNLYTLAGETLKSEQLLDQPRISEPIVAAPNWYKSDLLQGISHQNKRF